MPTKPLTPSSTTPSRPAAPNRTLAPPSVVTCSPRIESVVPVAAATVDVAPESQEMLLSSVAFPSAKKVPPAIVMGPLPIALLLVIASVPPEMLTLLLLVLSVELSRV